MEHGVAIRADRPQVPDWVKHVFAADRGEWLQMVHVDEPCAKCSISAFKVELANHTGYAVVGEANPAGGYIALEPVDKHRLGGSFPQAGEGTNLIRILGRKAVKCPNYAYWLFS